MTFPIIQCATCIHFHSDNMQDETCNAFPHGIPREIYLGEHDHRLPYKGDNGIRYEPVPFEEGDPDEEIEERNESTMVAYTRAILASVTQTDLNRVRSAIMGEPVNDDRETLLRMVLEQSKKIKEGTAVAPERDLDRFSRFVWQPGDVTVYTAEEYERLRSGERERLEMERIARERRRDEMAGVLRSFGFTMRSKRGGSHRTWHHPKAPPVTIAEKGHGVVPTYQVQQATAAIRKGSEGGLMHSLEYYLSLPWTVQGRWIPEDGGYYLITIAEMPGFSVVGDTRAEAEQIFSGVLQDYLAAYLKSGQQPPVPAAFAAAS